MKYPVHFRDEAEVDLIDAATWYESQRKGLGFEFLDEIQHVSGLISDNPELFPVVYKNIRRALIRRFPFGVFYLVDDVGIVVLAVMHGSRDPSQWKKRM